MTLLGCLPKPLGGLSESLGDACSLGVASCQRKLPVSVATFRSHLEPLGGFNIVLWNTSAVCVHHPKIELGGCAALCSSPAVPLCCLFMVFPYLLAPEVQHRYIKLGCDLSLLCSSDGSLDGCNARLLAP